MRATATPTLTPAAAEPPTHRERHDSGAARRTKMTYLEDVAVARGALAAPHAPPWAAEHEGHALGEPAEPLRHHVAALLHGASLALARVARHLAARREALVEPVLEFHAEAGAPEGALYVDGRLVGHLPGVKRL
jgi:hypothetical protein